MYVVNGKGSLIRLIAGIFVLGSALLGYFVHINFLFFTMFVGTMLLLSATTGFCPMELILKALKVPEKKVK
jgi:hypothetical protein